MNIKFVLILILFVFTSQSEANNYDVERGKYIKALKYYKNKNYKEFNSIKKELTNYPLYSNLVYKDLHRKRNINDDKVIRIIKTYNNSYISDKA